MIKIKNFKLKLGALLLGIGLTVVGCSSKQPKNFDISVDLNDDKIPEIVAGNYGEKGWDYVDYDLKIKLSNPDGTYQDPQLLMKFKNGFPHRIQFTDRDNDGDIDLVFSEYGKTHDHYQCYDTYMVKNDGKGNFSKPELTSRIYERP